MYNWKDSSVASSARQSFEFFCCARKTCCENFFVRCATSVARASSAAMISIVARKFHLCTLRVKMLAFVLTEWLASKRPRVRSPGAESKTKREKLFQALGGFLHQAH